MQHSPSTPWEDIGPTIKKGNKGISGRRLFIHKKNPTNLTSTVNSKTTRADSHISSLSIIELSDLLIDLSEENFNGKSYGLDNVRYFVKNKLFTFGRISDLAEVTEIVIEYFKRNRYRISGARNEYERLSKQLLDGEIVTIDTLKQLHGGVCSKVDTLLKMQNDEIRHTEEYARRYTHSFIFD